MYVHTYVRTYICTFLLLACANAPTGVCMFVCMCVCISEIQIVHLKLSGAEIGAYVLMKDIATCSNVVNSLCVLFMYMRMYVGKKYFCIQVT